MDEVENYTEDEIMKLLNEFKWAVFEYLKLSETETELAIKNATYEANFENFKATIPNELSKAFALIEEIIKKYEP